MKSVPVQPPLSAEFLSNRGVIANSAHADQFSQLLAGMKTMSANDVQGLSVTRTPGLRDEFGAELFKDIHGLDKIMEGMEVASKLNTNALHASKDEMAMVSETEGSTTSTFWKRRDSAWSFSKTPRYSV